MSVCKGLIVLSPVIGFWYEHNMPPILLRCHPTSMSPDCCLLSVSVLFKFLFLSHLYSICFCSNKEMHCWSQAVTNTCFHYWFYFLRFYLIIWFFFVKIMSENSKNREEILPTVKIRRYSVYKDVKTEISSKSSYFFSMFVYVCVPTWIASVS